MSGFIYILIIIFFAILSSFLPIGNERSTVRRLPCITFLIIGLNVLIYFSTLPAVADDMKSIATQGMKLQEFLMSHPDMFADEDVRKRLLDAGIISKGDEEMIQAQMKVLENIGGSQTSDPEAEKEFNNLMDKFQEAREASIWYKYGFAPNGQWKSHQLITSAFMHANFWHLFGNVIIFFAVAFTLEDLWGRAIFLGFYLMGAAASCIPSVLMPEPLVGIGASGAISATLGAFLVRLPKVKIKLFVLPGWFFRFLMGFKNFSVLVPGYVYLVAWFVSQLIAFYLVKKSGGISTVGYTVHIAGFIFGAGFAAFMRASKIEETHIHPKIEAKVSFSAPPEITDALELLDKGETVKAEQKLRPYLARHPDDLDAILAMIQIYQRTSNYDQLNAMYGRLIRYHLSRQDKEAALYAYDCLLQAFPDDNVAARIPARDWIAICEYLRESDMIREASVEYERLMNAWPDDPLAVRAAVQGADAALMCQDTQRALKMYERAQAMNPPKVLISGIEAGIEKCRRILDNRPAWVKQPPKAPTIYKGY
ncbi:MAG TPA: rhomboid family intramembrane serine protease [Blastocatellia bacterium]|nr:rhomboid family intramembrane serine protease [Blastocatellia bacterium]